jgi:hypothetical protein
MKQSPNRGVESCMANKAVSMPVKAGAEWSPAPTLAELVRDYQKATERYGAIARYLKDAMEVLTKPEWALVLDFAGIDKNYCERLHREIHDRLAAERRGV